MGRLQTGPHTNIETIADGDREQNINGNPILLNSEININGEKGNLVNLPISRVGQHHSFDIDLAAELKSVELAIMVHHFQYWIRHNAVTGKNYEEGRTWTYQTLKDIAGHFVYWSVKQVERFLNRLVELKILIKGNFNKSPYDRTVWYAFENEKKFAISRNREIEIPESGNQDPQIGTPIPDNITYTKTNKEPPTPKGESAAAEIAPKNLKKEISKEAKELAEQFVSQIKKHKPDYVAPKKLDAWNQAAQEILVDHKRDPVKVLKVLDHALSDTEVNGTWKGWYRLIVCRKNPVAYIGEKYDGIDASMSMKDKKQSLKAAGFCPNSDQSKVKQMAADMLKKAGY